jgi:ribosomal protein S12 methylthiotransferase accessory factor YcaO
VYLGEPAAEINLATIGIEAEFSSLFTVGMRLRIGVLPEQFGIHVALAALCSDYPDRPAVSFGSSGGLDLGRACRAAALEAVQTYHFAWQALARGEQVKIPRDARTRALWWAQYGTGYDTKFIEAQSGGRPAGNPSRAWDFSDLSDLLATAGHDLAFLDITPPYASENFRVARVIVPSLLELCPDERFPYLRAPRFEQAVEKFRLRRGARNATVPHPFF